ncbi:Ig-like domain-containing protein [Bradyrhizobium sp. RDI18]|uniref:Ig-like domain-containing protein n=1 Tax=Bradyrhizobium sp. RDI18 TaxID=3367400 RepID=UPI00371D2FD7
MTGIVDPARFGMPDATTAGVKAGVTLTPYTGPMNITRDGTIIENMVINGQLTIDAANVTIRNCIIQSNGWWGIEGEDAPNLRVEYCDIIGGNLTNSGILGSGTFVGNDIRHVSIGIQLTDGASTVSSNYIHDLFYGSADPHYDGVTLLGRQNHVVVEHNTISVPSNGGTAAVFIKNDFGPINDVIVRDNLMLGDPSFTMYTDASTSNGAITNVLIENNYLDRGYYGYISVTNSSPTIRNNVQWNNNTDPTPYPTSAPPPPSTPTAPSAPTIASFSNDTGVAGDGITSDNTLQLKGTAAANSTIKIYDGSTQIGTATASSTGSWDYITSVLSNAKHVLTATATNSSGQTSAASAAVTMTVDTVAPTAPVLSSNSIVNANQVKLSGTAEVNSKVTIYDGNTVVGTGTTNSSGAWSVTTNALSIGTHALTVKATDVAGNVSTASQSISSVISGSSSAPTTQIESAGTTSFVQSGDKYYLNPVAGGAGPSLKLNGVAVVSGQFGAWTPIGAEQTASGYQIAWKYKGADQYLVWATDSNGNFISNAIGVSSGSSTALKSMETSFHQNLNGDGTIGVPTAVIETFGSTSTVNIGGNYFLNPVAGSTGPSLKLNGAAVVSGQFGAWTPIGAEQTASGYQIAWKYTGADQYLVWATDSNGNFISNAIGVSSGSGTALKSIETSFHQDLNGDGTIGVPTAVIESYGSTTLIGTGANYFLDPVAGGTGPSLKLNGAAVTAGQFGAWTPIGTEQTSSGYQVAWKYNDADQYLVWATDSNGNFTSNAIGVSSGSSTALKSLETTFHQDLNGDGVIGASSAGASVGLTTMYKDWSGIVTIKGVADANSQIKLYDGNASLGTVTTAADGTWSFKTSSAVSDAVHTYTAKQIDSSGQVVGTSGSALLGSTGSNTLKSTSGNDILVGGGQADTFVFAANFGRDVIKDFVASGTVQDTIQFSKNVFDNFASVLSHASQVGQDIVISTGSDTLTLKNTKLSALSGQDFHFA